MTEFNSKNPVLLECPSSNISSYPPELYDSESMRRLPTSTATRATEHFIISMEISDSILEIQSSHESEHCKGILTCIVYHIAEDGECIKSAYRSMSFTTYSNSSIPLDNINIVKVDQLRYITVSSQLPLEDKRKVYKDEFEDFDESSLPETFNREMKRELQ